MDLPFRGHYDQATVNRAVALATQPPRRAMRLRWGLLGGWLLVVVYLAAPVLLNPSPEASARLTRPLLVLLILTAFAVYPYLKTLSLARRLWRKPGMQAERAGALTDQGLVYRARDGDRLLEWSQFTQRRQAPDLIVLTTASGAITILPRRFFTDDDDWRRAQAAVAQRLPEEK